MVPGRFESREIIVWDGFTGFVLLCLVIVNGILSALKNQEMLEHRLISKLSIEVKGKS